MTDIMMDFESYLVAANLIDVLYKDRFPEHPDDVVAMYEYSGFGSLPQIDSPLRSFQIVSRGKSAAYAKAKIWEIYKALISETTRIDLTAERWCTVNLRQAPFKLRMDNNGRSHYAFNLYVRSIHD